jgi:hypothetical protein
MYNISFRVANTYSKKRIEMSTFVEMKTFDLFKVEESFYKYIYFHVL